MTEKSMSQETTRCINCGSEAVENYCPVCGQKTHHKRFSLKTFFVSILAAFNIERGFLYTLKMLFVDPGKVIRDYISGRTRPYSNPLQYLMIAAGISAFLVLWLKIFDQSIEVTNELFSNEIIKANPEALEFQQKWMVFVRRYINFIPLLIIPFSSLFLKWYYRSAKLWYGEHLIINSYVFAQAAFISIFLMPLVIIFPSLSAKFEFISTFVELAYSSYAFKKIFKRSVFKSVFGGIFVYLFGLILFVVTFSFALFLIIFILAKMGIDIRQLMG